MFLFGRPADLPAAFKWFLKPPPRSLLPQPTHRNRCDPMDRGRPVTMYGTDYWQRQASPGCTRQSQSANPARDRLAQLAWHRDLRQLKDPAQQTGQNLGVGLDELLAQRLRQPNRFA